MILHHTVSRIIFGLLAILLASSNSLAQNFGSIEGKVFETKTNESLPGASVYLASMSIGVASGSDGSFLLEKIPNGKYDLIVSMVGYKTFSKPMIFYGNSVKNFVIYLDEEATLLNAVEVKAKRPAAATNDFLNFRKSFLGPTQNANRCEIVNSYDILVISSGPILAAKAQVPIEIVNNALGYRVFYILKEFMVDRTNNTMKLSGIARFENLIPESEKQERKWIRERDRAYYGSVEHFVRSLKSKELKKNHFTLWGGGVELNEQNLIVPNQDSIISYRGKLRVIFTAEFAEPSYDPKRRLEESVLDFNGRHITLYDNGKYESFHDIKLLEYFGWSSGVAELMPLGYQPSSKLR